MDIKQRRWLYSLFIFLFFVISPLIIAYALGYRLDTDRWNVTKVGALYIKSYPAGARIYVNDKLTKRKTPSQVINIPVGPNIFKVEKDSYQPWTKKLEVTAGNTTFVQDILIFKQDFKKQNLGAGGSQLLATRTNDLYAYLTASQELITVNTTNQTSNSIATLPSSAKLQQWSNDNRTILYSVDANWYLLSLATRQSTPVTIRPARVIEKALIGENAEDIWILSQQILYRWNAETQISTLIMTKVRDFAIGDGQIAILTTTGLSLSNLTDDTRTISPFEATADTELVRVSRDLVLLARADQYWIWRNAGIEHRINATTYDWKKNTILFGNGYELNSYDFGSGNVSVVDRTSTLSTNVSWHPSTNYFARVQNSILDLVELDSRGDKRHVIPISTIGPTDSYVFDPKGEYIYILTPEENYSLELQ